MYIQLVSIGDSIIDPCLTSCNQFANDKSWAEVIPYINNISKELDPIIKYAEFYYIHWSDLDKISFSGIRIKENRNSTEWSVISKDDLLKSVQGTFKEAINKIKTGEVKKPTNSKQKIEDTLPIMKDDFLDHEAENLNDLPL